MDRGAGQVTVHGITKNRLSHSRFHSLSRFIAIAYLHNKNVIQLTGKIEPKALHHDLSIYFN